MSITDELRKYADTFDTVAEMKSEGGISLTAIRLRTIANHIDQAHERLAREQYDKGHNDGFDEGFASADDWYVDHANELGEHGWVRLPVDADGKAIRIGDVLDSSMTLITASRMVVDENGRWLLQDTNGTFWYDPANLHHVKPTVEDVLREFGECWDDPAHYAKGELVETFADRIREAVEHE